MPSSVSQNCLTSWHITLLCLLTFHAPQSSKSQHWLVVSTSLRLHGTIDASADSHPGLPITRRRKKKAQNKQKPMSRCQLLLKNPRSMLVLRSSVIWRKQSKVISMSESGGTSVIAYVMSHGCAISLSLTSRFLSGPSLCPSFSHSRVRAYRFTRFVRHPVVVLRQSSQ